MEWPTLNHVFYIPLILGLGVLFGYWWGRRSLMIRLAEEERAQRLREQRRTERRARLHADESSVQQAASPAAPNEMDT